MRYRHPLESKESQDEKRELDLLMCGLTYNFHNTDGNKTTSSSNSNTSTKNVAKAWSQLGFESMNNNGYEYDLIHELEGYGGQASHSIGGGISSHSTPSSPSLDTQKKQQQPAVTLESLFSAAVSRTSSVLGLDKAAFLTRGGLFPPTSLPDRGPNGHMALMDCVFNALSSPPPESDVIMNRIEREFNALNSSNSKQRSSHDDRMAQVLAAGRGKPHILLPDLIIAFAICRLAEWDMEYRGYREEERATSRDKAKETGENKTDEKKVEERGSGQHLGGQKLMPPPRDDGLRLASLLAYQIYDGYQRQKTLTRDTLQRFLSDIHGEESYKTAHVKSTLDRMFEAPTNSTKDPPTKTKKILGGNANNNSTSRILNHVDADQFQRGIHATISYSHRSVSRVSTVHSSLQSPVATHILLDWILLLFNCMLPRKIPPPADMAEYFLRIVNSDPVRMIDTMSIKYGLYDDVEGGDNVLYEIRRRFHSLQKKNGVMMTTEKETQDGEEVDANRATLDNVCPETGELIVMEEGDDDDFIMTRPKNVVYEISFVNEVSMPNVELGHGGYLPAELASLTFRACSSQETAAKTGPAFGLWGDATNNDLESKELSQSAPSESYWTLYDAVSFGCQAVRWDALQRSSHGDAEEVIDADAHNKYDSEMPLLELAFKTFLQLPRQDGKRNEHSLDRSQIGKMLLLLLEHESFRLEADSPPNEEDEISINDEAVSRKASNESGGVLSTLVDVSYASLLGLVPPKLDLSQYTKTTISETGDKSSSKTNLPLHILVDYVVSESMSKTNQSRDGAIDFQGFVHWHLRLASESSETRLGPYLLDLRLIAAVLLGVKPASPKMEKYLIDQIKRRHKYRFPRTKSGSSQPRGPKGTIWYVINADWFRLWDHYTEGKMSDNYASGYHLGKIDNNMLLSEEGILSLKQGLHWQRDFQLVEPLVWSALQAWHDGGPPIPRSVVPFNPDMTDKQNHMSYSPTKNTSEYEIELYPLYATVFLCDVTTQGEPRPFQQFVALSRYLPLSELVDTLRDGLGRDFTKQSKNDKGVLHRPPVRLWMMDASSASMLLAASPPSKVDESVGWLLDTDLPIVDESNMRDVPLGKEVCLMLELRNEQDGTWPRGKSTGTLSNDDNKDENQQRTDKETVKLGDGIVGMYNMG